MMFRLLRLFDPKLHRAQHWRQTVKPLVELQLQKFKDFVFCCVLVGLIFHIPAPLPFAFLLVYHFNTLTSLYKEPFPRKRKEKNICITPGGNDTDIWNFL